MRIIKPTLTILVIAALSTVAAFLFLEDLNTSWMMGQVSRWKPVPSSSEQIKLTPIPRYTDIRAIYITNPNALENNKDYILDLASKSELNAVVVTMKSGGGVSLPGNIKDILGVFRSNGIYTIARVVVFKDTFLASERPHLALKNSLGGLWRDSSGANWVDPSSRDVWDYNIDITKNIIDLGFNEINFDYIRFPSDGALSDSRYPYWDGVLDKNEVIKNFSSYIYKNLKAYNADVVLSADIFAYVLLTRVEGAGIGQKLEYMAESYDVISPMIYPSHYSFGNFGFENPAEYPYEVVLGTLVQGRAKLEAASSTYVMRPWLQAFNMGAEYGEQKIHLQKQAVLDSGYNEGWMLWNARNLYSKDFFETKKY